MSIQILPQYDLAEQLGLGVGGGFAQEMQRQRELADKLTFLQEQQKGTLAEKLLEKQVGAEKKDIQRKALLNAGVPSRLADLYAEATEGGKTEILKGFFELEQRGMLPVGLSENLAEEIGVEDEVITPNFVDRVEEEKFKFPRLEEPVGLSAKERAARKLNLEKTNLPLYKGFTDKLQGLAQENFRLNKLEQLNESGKLPQGLQRINVNPSTGELILPFAANEETQEFMKIVNDFTTQAKNSYGSRITNFELDRFMKRLPGLMNSTEGRRSIIKMMKEMNELSGNYNESIKDAWDHYGIENANFQQIERTAAILRKKREKSLINSINRDFKKLDAISKRGLDKKELSEVKRPTPDEKGTVIVKTVDGRTGRVPLEQYEKMKADGVLIE